MGIPGRPIMILSSALYKTFNNSEKEYVILHEAGHSKLNHSIKEAVVFIVLFIVMVFVQRDFFATNSLFTALLLGVAAGISNIQIARLFEHEADNFAVRRMADPQGMIGATKKFIDAYKKITPPENSFVHLLFYRGAPYSKRIAKAQIEMERRKEATRLKLPMS